MWVAFSCYDHGTRRNSSRSAGRTGTPWDAPPTPHATPPPPWPTQAPETSLQVQVRQGVLVRFVVINLAVTPFDDVHVRTSKPQARTRPTARLLEVYRESARNSPVAAGVAAVYAYEAQVPRVAQAKIDGLRANYGIEDRPALSFFEVHAALDVEHSAAERAHRRGHHRGGCRSRGGGGPGRPGRVMGVPVGRGRPGLTGDRRALDPQMSRRTRQTFSCSARKSISATPRRMESPFQRALPFAPALRTSALLRWNRRSHRVL